MAFTVHGGAGGVSADLAELDSLHRLFALAATADADAVAECARAACSPAVPLAGALDPLGAARAHERVLAGVRTLGELVLLHRGLAEAVRAAELVYRLTETQVNDVLLGLWHGVRPVVAPGLLLGAAAGALTVVATRSGVVAGQTLVAQAPAAVRAVVAGQDVGVVARRVGDTIGGSVGGALKADGREVLDWLVQHPVLAREALATLPVLTELLAPDDPQATSHGTGAAGFTTLLLAAGRTRGLFVEKPVQITGSTTSQRAAPVGVSDLASRLTHLTDPRGDLTGYRPMQGGVVVERLEPERGRPRRWIVYLPPTNDWGVRGGPYASDLTSNLGMVGKQGMRNTGLGSGRGKPDAVDEALLAMREAGVRPGEPVLLVGFSQGGITAASLASDPEIRRDVSVRGVFTAGSPISEFALPDDVATLSLENETDPVPLLDGGTNPDRTNWTTVTGHVLGPDGNPMIRERMAGGEPFAGHYLDGYLQLAAEAERSGDPSVQQWQASMGDFLGTGENGRSVTRTEFTTRRVSG